MKLRKLPGLLILLVSSSFLDDAWAAATLDTADDVQAAGNNVYLRPAPRAEDNSCHEELTLSAGESLCPAGPLVPAPGTGIPRERPSTPVGTPLLYVLMSLQR
jgi:hypothetical protein